MEVPEIVEHFFGVYLLYCTNPVYKGRTYIGYTVDPRRRIKQHNAGKKFGGAWKTSKKGPWKMVLIVHGFPNPTSALQFEWAWQYPDLSRRLRHLPKRKSKQNVFEYRLSVLSEMLKVGPWCRLPLTLRWLDHEFSENYSTNVSPPIHMPVSYGKVVSKTLKNKSPKKKSECKTLEPEDHSIMFCSLCNSCVKPDDKITCVNSNCHLMAHVICLSRVFTKDEMLLPIEGNCPACRTNVLWGDLIRKKIGCYLHLKNTDAEANESNDDSDRSCD